MTSSQHGPTVSLLTEDYFERRRPFISGGKPLWVVREQIVPSVVSTVVSLYIVNAALRCVDTLGNTAPQHYELETTTSCTDHLCPTPLREEDLPGLRPKFFIYWYYTAYVVLSMLLLLDILRLSKISSSVIDVMLGFHSATRERWRPYIFCLFLVPFVHLSYGFTLPLEPDSCCKWRPTRSAMMNHIMTLAFLLFVSGSVMLGDAHNHGYFLLRVPTIKRDAIELLRNEIMKQDDTTDPETDEDLLLLEGDTATSSRESPDEESSRASR